MFNIVSNWPFEWRATSLKRGIVSSTDNHTMVVLDHVEWRSSRDSTGGHI